MIDSKDFLIPLEAKKALLVSDTDWGLDELSGLLKTMGGLACERVLIPLGGKYKIDPATYMGSGKLKEVARTMEAQNLDLLLLDFDLSPSQLKNIEKEVKRLVLDRSGIILEIFNRHARTREAKLQVELARLQYLMPRLKHLWSHFERQQGRGMGEKQIEVDKRLVKDRVTQLKGRIKEVEKSRKLRRERRNDILKVAIVGYTNAGKSTLLNALTESDALVEDALFATLDAQVKLLNPKSRPTVVAIDTVGFIDRLPHSLVASFKSTLEEILEADLIVHVLDASHSEVKRHYEVTMNVLKEIGEDSFSADQMPMMVVFNKMDQVKPSQTSILKVWAAGLARERGKGLEPVFISAYDQTQVVKLREQILKFFDYLMETYEIIVPFEDGKTAASLFELGRVETKRTTKDGTFFRIRTLPQFAKRLNIDRYKI